jgi:hypothetical protein
MLSLLGSFHFFSSWALAALGFSGVFRVRLGKIK